MLKYIITIGLMLNFLCESNLFSSKLKTEEKFITDLVVSKKKKERLEAQYRRCWRCFRCRATNPDENRRCKRCRAYRSPNTYEKLW